MRRIIINSLNGCCCFLFIKPSYEESLIPEEKEQERYTPTQQRVVEQLLQEQAPIPGHKKTDNQLLNDLKAFLAGKDADTSQFYRLSLGPRSLHEFKTELCSYMFSDNAHIWCKSNAGEWICIHLTPDYNFEIVNSDEVVYADWYKFQADLAKFLEDNGLKNEFYLFRYGINPATGIDASVEEIAEINIKPFEFNPFEFKRGVTIWARKLDGSLAYVIAQNYNEMLFDSLSEVPEEVKNNVIQIGGMYFVQSSSGNTFRILENPTLCDIASNYLIMPRDDMIFLPINDLVSKGVAAQIKMIYDFEEKKKGKKLDEVEGICLSRYGLVYVARDQSIRRAKLKDGVADTLQNLTNPGNLEMHLDQKVIKIDYSGLRIMLGDTQIGTYDDYRSISFYFHRWLIQGSAKFEYKDQEYKIKGFEGNNILVEQVGFVRGWLGA